MVLWDLEGKDLYVDVNISYLRGAMGFFLVADGTRKETLEIALSLRSRALELIGPTPHCLLINKADLLPNWEITDNDLKTLVPEGVPVIKTSARTGSEVNEAFNALAGAML